MLARGAQHHESERAACEQAYTEQQRGHAEDARGGWLRGQVRRSRTLGVVVRVGRGGRVPSTRPECEHTPRCTHTARHKVANDKVSAVNTPCTGAPYKRERGGVRTCRK